MMPATVFALFAALVALASLPSHRTSAHARRDLSHFQAAPSVHAFFYLWYGSPATDGEYRHWIHEVLPHWEAQVNSRHPTIGQRFSPPQNLHSPYFPLRGPYSSSDPGTIRSQLRDLARAGVDVAVVSWWGQASKPYATDTQGVNTDKVLQTLLEVADKFYGDSDTDTTSASASAGGGAGAVRIALHLEPYPSRSAQSVREDIEYIACRYGHHKSLFRAQDGRILLYVYDSYHVSPSEWARVLTDAGDLSVRRGSVGGTDTARCTDAAGTVTTRSLDAWVLGLWLQREHGADLAAGGFDGVYSYFGSAGFSYGSSVRHWQAMRQFCAHPVAAPQRERVSRRNQHTVSTGGSALVGPVDPMLCSFSVAPGYNDTLIRPWNAATTRSRRGGLYYGEMWEEALRLSPVPQIVSVTSYNEWGEGTQIEPAVAVDRTGGGARDGSTSAGHGNWRTYESYDDCRDAAGSADTSAYAYVDMTAQFASRLKGMGLHLPQADADTEAGAGAGVHAEDRGDYDL